MLLRIFRIDQNIINKDNNKLIQVRLEDTVHIVHKDSGSIGNTEGHHQKLIMTISSSEGGLGDIWGFDAYLMITGP
ncbi:hypothetical protein A2U01_0082874 [Trifolium medium]|uniref:Uncharacterized protein n=1 Tax=Trifolium medium TaxID=97028 RepID=A0A392TME6_9FABA|nr:hypothetical protein [Trifolium medium]